MGEKGHLDAGPRIGIRISGISPHSFLFKLTKSPARLKKKHIKYTNIPHLFLAVRCSQPFLWLPFSPTPGACALEEPLGQLLSIRRRAGVEEPVSYEPKKREKPPRRTGGEKISRGNSESVWNNHQKNKVNTKSEFGTTTPKTEN